VAKMHAIEIANRQCARAAIILMKMSENLHKLNNSAVHEIFDPDTQ
jgi:hypothetical protein